MPLSKLGLLPRISLALFAVGFLPLVLVSLQLIGLTTEAQKDSVWGAQLKAASAAASHINEYIYLRQGLAKSIAANPVLLQDAKSQDAAVVLQSTLEAFVDLEGLALVNGARQLVVRAVREGGSEGALERGARRSFVRASRSSSSAARPSHASKPRSPTAAARAPCFSSTRDRSPTLYAKKSSAAPPSSR